MKLGYTILYVNNVLKTLNFYQKVFGFEIKFLHESGDYGELNTGNTTLSFSSIDLMEQLGKNPGKPHPDSPCFEIAFITENVEETLQAALTAGAELIQAPEKMEWGQTVAYISDPNGFLIEICTEVAN
ncbi:VOC family protein [Zophobihabitans entericus]|uniref:VOC family protein n=1 Tax=Zophobihabitans entericus TaxID=1635327 RepID=A0A6G9I9C3_9GAMM|nr:VOC family protein [Zophobihabitans entericus]QIQ20816.1 VOC family protein [Zophobihabitans entericus]